MGFFDWMFGTTPEVNKPVEVVKEKPKPKVIDIKLHIDLEESYYKIRKFACDGYIIPNIHSPYDAGSYLRDWMKARHIGEDYNFEAVEFLQACIETKTTSSLIYYGYEIKVTVMNNPQTHTKEN